MLFCEVYSSYFHAVSAMITKAVEGELNEKNAIDIIRSKAFSESEIYILNAIKSGDWQIFTKDFQTPIKHMVEMPMTTLQLRFLKAITLDPRFLLFEKEIGGLEDVAPLYQPDDFYCFDLICDGDPYTSEAYQKIFKTIFTSIQQKRRVNICFQSGKGGLRERIYIPKKLEYSAKDDKFRLICVDGKNISTINVARIHHCEILDEYDESDVMVFKERRGTVTLQLKDQRDALERAMLHFANFEKETRHMEGITYEMKMSYNRDDETELLIRVLSFGPMVKVVSPESFIKQVKVRLDRQKNIRMRAASK